MQDAPCAAGEANAEIAITHALIHLGQHRFRFDQAPANRFNHVAQPGFASESRTVRVVWSDRHLLDISLCHTAAQCGPRGRVRGRIEPRKPLIVEAQ